MLYLKLTKVIFNIFFLSILSGCGATLLSYNPTVNTNVLDAMQSIRELILTQQENRSPKNIYITENYIKIYGEFEGDKSPSEGAAALIRFSNISNLTFHHKNEWFMVSLIGNNRKLFRYHTHKEGDAKKLMDDIYTMMQHKSDPYKPIVLENQTEVKNSLNVEKNDLKYNSSFDSTKNTNSNIKELSATELDKITDQLKKLKDLKDSNILTKEEYDAKKSILIEKIK